MGPLTLFSLRLASPSLRSIPQMTVQPSISTVPWKTLYSLANLMLPFSMFRSRHSSLFLDLPAESPRSFFPSYRRPRTSQLSNLPTLLRAIFFRIRTSEKHAPNPFRIRTSKTQDLKPFGMNTYEKTRGGGTPLPRYFAHTAPVLFSEEDKPPIQPSLRGRTETLDPVRNHWYIACHTEGLTLKESATPSHTGGLTLRSQSLPFLLHTKSRKRAKHEEATEGSSSYRHTRSRGRDSRSSTRSHAGGRPLTR